jgi:hypothetical protein
MGNMSYCRHINTKGDLEDVEERWYEFDTDDTNRDEMLARLNLVKLIHEMAQNISIEDVEAEMKSWRKAEEKLQQDN